MKEMLKELAPPDLPALTRYRLVISGTVLGLLVSAGASWGLFGLFGIPGFAYASDVDDLKLDVGSIKIDLLEERMYTARRLWCGTKTQESRQFYNRQISAMHRQYFKWTGGISVDLPTCKELGFEDEIR